MYKYKNSGDVYNTRAKAQEVHEAILDIEEPYFRLERVNQEVEQSRSAIHYHMKELVRRGYLIQVGKQYVDVQELPEWTVWQIGRLLNSLEAEAEKAQELKLLYQEKKELAKEQLEEMAKESSNRWKKRQVERLQELQSREDYYESKAENMYSALNALTKVYVERKRTAQENSEKSCMDSPHNLIRGSQIPA